MSSFFKSSLSAFLEAASNLKGNKETTLITILTIAVAVAILSLFLIVYFNLNGIVTSWSENLQLVVYLKDDIKEPATDQIEEALRSEEGVEKWDFLSKDDALTQFKERLKDKSVILEGLGSNPLPASFNIYFREDNRNYEEIRRLAERSMKMEGVEDVDYGGEWIARFEAAIFFLKVFIVAVGGLLCVGLITIISNTIRLSVYSRSDEVEIKKLVGAARWFIQAPFLAEGIIQGVLGVLLALGILFVFFSYFVLNLFAGSQILMGVHISFIPGAVVCWMIVLGGVIGGAGSFMAIGKLMRFDRPI